MTVYLFDYCYAWMISRKNCVSLFFRVTQIASWKNIMVFHWTYADYMTNECDASAIFYLLFESVFRSWIPYNTRRWRCAISKGKHSSIVTSTRRRGHLPHSEHVFINFRQSRCWIALSDNFYVNHQIWLKLNLIQIDSIDFKCCYISRQCIKAINKCPISDKERLHSNEARNRNVLARINLNSWIDKH